MPETRIYEPTELQLYTFCPHKYKLQRIAKAPMGSMPPYLLRGIVGHQILSHGLKFFDDIFEAAITYYRNCMDERYTSFDIADKEIEKIREELFLSISNFEKCLKIMGIVIGERERKMHYNMVVDGRETKFSGTPDAFAVFEDTPQGMLEILDFKFGRKQAPQQLNRNIQFGHYFIAAKQSGISVHRIFWVNMNDFLLYKRDGKNAKKGDLKGPGFYPVRIGAEDTDYIKRASLDIITAIEHEVFPQNSYGPGSPCGYCEYASQGICDSFSIGTKGGDLENGI